MLNGLKRSPGQGAPTMTLWGIESQAPALRSAACWAASLQRREPQRRTLRLRAALHQASRRSGGQPHLQAMALHSCLGVGWKLVELMCRVEPPNGRTQQSTR